MPWPDPSARKARQARAGRAPPGLWRREVGEVQRVFRWLNEAPYLISVPFIVIFLFGIAFKSRSLALFGATFVVLLNLGRIAAGRRQPRRRPAPRRGQHEEDEEAVPPQCSSRW